LANSGNRSLKKEANPYPLPFYFPEQPAYAGAFFLCCICFPKLCFMKRVAALNLFIGLVIGLMITAQLSFNHAGVTNDPISKKINAPALPDQISFAGEAVPLDKWDVRERLDREVLLNYYNHANMLLLMKLANRYFPSISERLKRNGIPDDFKYLCVAESNLFYNAISHSGAVGFWQFMDYSVPGTMEVNDQVDYRYDLDQSTDAACGYLKEAKEKFGNWTAAAASFNCGMGGYNKQASFQKTTNYYDLLLPEETNRYIFRILAFKHLMEHASELGFTMNDSEKYIPVRYRSVRVSTTINNLADFAIANGTNYKVLRLMNPWMRGKSLTIKQGKSYEIRLPDQTNQTAAR
jgi:membrane-bound lytic murein transglycosylase D